MNSLGNTRAEFIEKLVLVEPDLSQLDMQEEAETVIKCRDPRILKYTSTLKQMLLKEQECF